MYYSSVNPPWLLIMLNIKPSVLMMACRILHSLALAHFQSLSACPLHSSHADFLLFLNMLRAFPPLGICIGCSLCLNAISQNLHAFFLHFIQGYFLSLLRETFPDHLISRSTGTPRPVSPHPVRWMWRGVAQVPFHEEGLCCPAAGSTVSR